MAVVGPTATGKTRLAVRIALWLGSEIVSADSRQVYRGMDIGTGKDLDEYEIDGRRIPYHLIDVVEPTEDFSVFAFQQAAYAVIRDLHRRGRIPVLCGGTGLYLDAVIRAYRMRAVPEDPELRRRLSGLSCEALVERLLELRPDYHTRGDFRKPERLIRAIEIALAGGADPVAPAPPELRPVVLGVRRPRPELRARIRRRLAERFEAGLVDEVRRLLASGVPRKRLDVFGLEYRWVAALVAGEITEPECFEGLATAIAQFAKRQETWFRGMEKKGVRIHWIDRDDPEAALALLRRFGLGPEPAGSG